MEDLRRYAPILHTGFAENYTAEQMRNFVTLVHERGYSGFSVEGKSSTGPTTDIDGWVDGYMRGLALACEEAKKQGLDRKSTRLNSSHRLTSRMPSSA